jgi:hypothetical protein
MPLSRKISGGQTRSVPPPWLEYISKEYEKVNKTIKKSVYLTNVVAYFTGGGSTFYPTSNGTVRLTSLDETELNKLELISLDPLRIALQQCIQSNLVEGASTSRNRMSDMKTAMDRLKTDARFAKSQPFSSWPQEEQAVWNCFHIPIPNSHPAFKELMKLKGENIRISSSTTGTGSRGTSMTDFTRYYKAALNFTDFFKNYYGLTKTQLQTCELPTYDKRRLTLSVLRQSFKDSLCTNSPQNSSALTNALKPFLVDPDETPPTSWPLTPAEKTAYSTIPSKQCIPISEPILFAPPEQILSGGTRNRESLKTRRNRRKRGYYKH